MCVATNHPIDCIIRVHHPWSELLIVVSIGPCASYHSIAPAMCRSPSLPLPSPPLPPLHHTTLDLFFRLAMPMMVINLGGEMMYILQQRLVAQNIPRDKVRNTFNPMLLKPPGRRCLLLPPKVDFGKRDHELLT